MSRYLCEFEVLGRVQVVFFQKYTKWPTNLLGVSGWCMITRDDAVKDEIEGAEETIWHMKQW